MITTETVTQTKLVRRFATGTLFHNFLFFNKLRRKMFISKYLFFCNAEMNAV